MGEIQGQLLLRSGVFASKGDYNMLTDSSSHSLADVSRALAHILSQPHGVDLLLQARPVSHPQWADTASDEVLLRKSLHAFVMRFLQDATTVKGLDDEAALAQLARTARRAQQIAAVCAPGADGDEVQAITLLWIQGLLKHCIAPGAELPDAGRMVRLLEAASSHHGDPREYLEALGASMSWASKKTSEAVVTAVADRLHEAEREEECEMFLGSQIIERGELTPGMAAVICPGGSKDARPHVFLYDFQSICRWQKEQGNDPTTRAQLSLRDIIKLS